MISSEAEAPLVYVGPERRLSCVCHPKHQRILSDHDEKIKQHEENLDDRVAELWTAIRGKLNAKIFLALVLTFAGTFFATMFYVVRDVQAIRLEIMKGITEVQMELQSVKAEVQVQSVRIGNIQNGFHNLEIKHEKLLENEKVKK